MRVRGTRVSPRLRWFLVAVLAVLVLLAGIAIGSWYVLERYGPLFARQRVEEALSRALDRPVSIGEVVLRPWLGRVQVLSLEIGPDPVEGGEPLLRLSRAQVGIAISSLWRREIVVSGVLLEDPALTLVSSRPSGSRFPLDLPDHFEVGPVRVQVRGVQVKRGRLVYRDPGEQLSLEVQGVEASVRPLNRGIDGRVEVASARLRLHAAREELTDIRVAGWVHQTQVSVRDLAARWNGHEVRVSGEVRQPFDAPVLHLKLRGEVDLADVARWTKAPWPVAGTAGVDGAVDGPMDALTVSGQLQMSTLAAGPIQAKAVAVSGEVRRLPKAPEVRLQVRGDIDLGPLAAEAGAPWPVSGTARAEGRVEGSPGALRVTGRVASPAVTAGPLQAHAVEVSGDVRGLPRTPDLQLQVRGDAELAGVGSLLDAPWPLGGTVTVAAALEGRWDALRVSGQVRVPSLAAGSVRARDVAVSGEIRALPRAPDLRLQVRGDVDLAGLAMLAGAPWPASGTAAVEATLEGPTRALKISGRGQAPTLATGPIRANAVAVSGDVRGLPGAPDLHLQVRGEIDLAPLGAEAGVPWAVSGSASAEVRVEGAPDALRVSGWVGVPRVTAGPLRVTEAMIEGRWEGRRLDLPSVRARVFDGELRGSLATHLDRPRETWMAFTLQRAKLPQVEALAPEPLGFRGEVDVEAALEGDPRRLADVRGRVRLDGRDIGLPGELSRLGPGAVALQGTIRDGTLDLSRASGSWAGVRIEASGPVGIEGPQGARASLDADLGRLLPLWEVRQVSGQAHLAGVLMGRWDNPEVSGQAVAPAATVSGIRVEALEMPFRLADRTLTLTAASGVLGQSRVGVSGHFTYRIDGTGQGVAASDSAPFHADVRAPAARLEDLDRWLPPDWQGSGRFALAGRVEGTLAAWRGAGTVEAAALRLRSGIPVRDLKSRFSLDPRRFDIAELQASVRDVPLRGAGGWRWDGTGGGTAEIGPVELDSLPEAPPAAGLRGTGRGRVAITTAPGRIEVVATGAVERAHVLGYPLGTGSLQGALRDGTLRADLAFPEARLTGAVRGRTDRDEPLSVRAEVSALEIAPMLRRAGGTGGVRIDGVVSAAADFLVPPSRPADAQGTIRLDPVRLTVEEEAWTNQGPVVVHWGPDGLRIERLQLASRLGSVRAAGRAEPSGRLELELAGQVPLAILPVLRPEVRSAEGLAVLTARVEGTASSPRLTGEATVRDGKLQLADYPETFRDLSGRVLISPEGLRLVEASALLGRGRLRASGEMTLAGWRPGVYRFALTGREVGLAPFEGLRTAWDADLELVGQGERAQLRGEARLLQGTYAGRLSLLSLILSERRERAAAPAFALPLRIQLRLDDNLRVETNLARLRVGGTLSLEGTTADPILFGSLESREGRITFRKNRYEIIAAAVRFTDPRKIDPILDVTARARIKDYDITVRLAGRPEELSVRFSSVPALGEEELLLLTTLGVTREEAGRSPAGIAAGQIANLLLDELLGPEVGQYSLDVFEIQTTGKAEQEQTTVRVGKQVTEDVRVLYSQSIAGASKRVLRVEYQIIGPLFLAGEQDFQGGVGGDVLVRFRFR